MSTINKEQLREDLKASTQNSSGMFEIGEETICALMSLLPAPPSPVSVPDAYVRDGRGRMMLNGMQEPRIGYSAGWNACRAAMLQGDNGNSSVIQDCSCRTCRPITLTDMRFVVCPECGNKRCPHANDHRNACTGSNEPGQEGSAYPAAPQQEVK